MKTEGKALWGLLPLVAISIAALLPLHAQIPGTDIYLASISKSGGTISVSSPVNITDRPGYDNQPSFLPDGRGILYTVIKEDGQADIHRYDIASGTTRQVTDTRESEYSPMMMRGGRTFSVVRVEMDSVQRLWQFNLDGKSPKLLLKDFQPVGYYAWGNDRNVGLFILGNPPELHIASTLSGTAERVWKNIGRSIQPMPGRNMISFIDRVSENESWIVQVDVRSKDVTPLIRTPHGSEFHTWGSDGTLWIAQGSKVLVWKTGMESSWRVVVDFTHLGIHSITRLAVSPRGDRLALVAGE